MNKIQAVSVALLAIAASGAAHATSTSGGAIAPTSFSVAAPATDGTGGTCSGLKEAVTIQLSANNYGVVNCPNATTGVVAVANGKGKGRVYGVSNNGGAVLEYLQDGTTLVTTANANTKTPYGSGADAASAAGTATTTIISSITSSTGTGSTGGGSTGTTP